MAKRTKPTRTYRVGLIVGREWSFPPAFIEEVNRRDAGVVGEYVKLGGTAHGRAGRLRRDHRPHLARGAVSTARYLKHAVLAGRHGRQQPVHVDGRRQVLRRVALRRSSASRSPKTVVLPNKDYVPGIVHDESLRNLEYPLDWQGDRRLRRPAVHPQGRPRRRLARRLRLPLARGADPPLRQSGPAHDDRAGVHRVGPVRPLPVPRPGGRAADAVRPARAQVHRRARATWRRRSSERDRGRLADAGAARSATT